LNVQTHNGMVIQYRALYSKQTKTISNSMDASQKLSKRIRPKIAISNV
jgi:hypothetical protein